MLFVWLLLSNAGQKPNKQLTDSSFVLPVTWNHGTQGQINFLVLLSPSDDHSRVVLTQLDGNPSSDYVNASYIDVSCDIMSVV